MHASSSGEPDAWPLADPFAEPFTRRTLVVPTAWYRQFFQNRPQTLRADQFREDIKLLHRVMTTVYGGWDSAQRLGWNWGAFFKDWDAALGARARDAIPLADAFAAWRKFMEVQLDNHSGPVLTDDAIIGHAGSWSAVLATAPAGPCTEFRNAKGSVYPIAASDPAQLPKKRHDIAGKPVSYLVTTTAKGPMAAVHCSDAWIPAEAAWAPADGERKANISALAQTEKDFPSFRSISPQIGYIRFPTFSKANVERIMKLEETLKGRKHDEELLIVDLRGNGGGDNRIEALNNWVTIPPVEFKMRVGASCLYPPLRWGYTQVSSSGLKPPISESLRRDLQGGLDALSQDDAAGCPAKFVEQAWTWSYVQHRYPSKPAGKTRLLALVDDGCGSDCEYAAMLIAAVPGSVIAGVNTFGVGQFIQPGYFVLPNTRLVFRVALGTSDMYGDGRSFDGYGLDVDLVLAKQEDQSPESIVALAKRLLAER
jgi:Peptidase family S41